MKKSFLASAWFPFLMCLVMGGVTAAAFAGLQPTGEGISNSQIVSAFGMGSWAAGPLMFFVSFIGICILNLIRRIVRLRYVAILHPIVILIGIVPWLILSWVVLDEPRYTGFAIAVMDFVARPMLWGSLTATLITILFSLPIFLSAKKKK